MQTKEQIKNWKVVASVATVAALGVTGLAIASPSDADTPPAIEVQDQRTGEAFTSTTIGQFEVVPGPSFSPNSDSLDSPLASAGLDSPAVDSASIDSPTPTTAPAPAPTAGDSPVADSPAVDSPSADSPAPAPAPAPTPDDSPSVDSPESAVSGDSLDS
jgi:hypothetical protein